MSPDASPTVLFVCTGNIFRSMTAEYALRAALGDGDPRIVGSAGLAEAPHEIVPFVRHYLADRGLDISAHRPTKLTGAALLQADLAVAMGTEHRDRIVKQFDRRLPLFSEVAYDTVEPLRDVYEVVPDWRNNATAAAAYGCSVMDYIFDGMPSFVRRMPAFFTG